MNKEVSEFNGDDYSKSPQKRKTKSPLKGDCVKDRHDKEEEMVSMTQLMV